MKGTGSLLFGAALVIFAPLDQASSREIAVPGGSRVIQSDEQARPSAASPSVGELCSPGGQAAALREGTSAGQGAAESRPASPSEKQREFLEQVRSEALSSIQRATGREFSADDLELKRASDEIRYWTALEMAQPGVTAVPGEAQPRLGFEFRRPSALLPGGRQPADLSDAERRAAEEQIRRQHGEWVREGRLRDSRVDNPTRSPTAPHNHALNEIWRQNRNLGRQRINQLLSRHPVLLYLQGGLDPQGVAQAQANYRQALTQEAERLRGLDLRRSSSDVLSLSLFQGAVARTLSRSPEHCGTFRSITDRLQHQEQARRWTSLGLGLAAGGACFAAGVFSAGALTAACLAVGATDVAVTGASALTSYEQARVLYGGVLGEDVSPETYQSRNDEAIGLALMAAGGAAGTTTAAVSAIRRTTSAAGPQLSRDAAEAPTVLPTQARAPEVSVPAAGQRRTWSFESETDIAALRARGSELEQRGLIRDFPEGATESQYRFANELVDARARALDLGPLADHERRAGYMQTAERLARGEEISDDFVRSLDQTLRGRMTTPPAPTEATAVTGYISPSQREAYRQEAIELRRSQRAAAEATGETAGSTRPPTPRPPRDTQPNEPMHSFREALDNPFVTYADNRRLMQHLDGLPVPAARGSRHSTFTPQQAQDLHDRVSRNPVASLCQLPNYDRTGTSGFCFGRAVATHVEALRMGLNRDSIRKVWAMGEVSGPNGRIWSYHVSTAVRGQDRRWYVIDSYAQNPMPLNDWYRAITAESGLGRTRLYSSAPSRVTPSAFHPDPQTGRQPSTRLQLGLDDPTGTYPRHMQRYYEDLMANFREESRRLIQERDRVPRP